MINLDGSKEKRVRFRNRTKKLVLEILIEKEKDIKTGKVFVRNESRSSNEWKMIKEYWGVGFEQKTKNAAEYYMRNHD